MQAFLTLLIEVFVVSFIAISVINIVTAALPEPVNTVVAPRTWAVAFEPIEPEPTFARSLNAGETPVQSCLTIDWVQPAAEESVEPVDVIAIAKHQIVSTLRSYKLRGEEVIRVDRIPFALPPIKTYKLRSQPVVKVSHLLAAI